MMVKFIILNGSYLALGLGSFRRMGSLAWRRGVPGDSASYPSSELKEHKELTSVVSVPDGAEGENKPTLRNITFSLKHAH